MMMLYREGDSYAASLDLATYKKTGWSIQQVVKRSDVFIPMPMDFFRQGNRTCFLFDMRDKYAGLAAYDMHTDYIRESLCVVCTEDGTVFTDLNGTVLTTPLDYVDDYYNFPRVVPETPLYEIAPQEISTPAISQHTFSDGNDLNQDGTVIEFEITKRNYNQARLDVKDGDRIVNRVVFQNDGQIAFSNGEGLSVFRQYTPGATHRIRMKYYFSFADNPFYRVWVDGHFSPPGILLLYRGSSF